MIIKDTKGKYELRVDNNRRIVYEIYLRCNEVFLAEDYERMDNDYRTKVIVHLGKGPWMKFCDTRCYIPNTSNNPEVMNRHLIWATENGLAGGVMLVESATLKMQVRRATKDTAQPTYFDNEKEADEWLKSQGY